MGLSWLTVLQDEEYQPASEMSTLLDEMLENLTGKVDQVGEEINAKCMVGYIPCVRPPN